MDLLELSYRHVKFVWPVKSLPVEFEPFRRNEKKPSDPTTAEKFNTYRFADYKAKVIDLLKRVCAVSVETMKIVKEMPLI